MAGIFDFLGANQGAGMYDDLLTPEQKARIGQQSMMNLGAQLLAASGRSDQPINVGQALGSAFLQSQKTRSEAEQAAVQGMLTKGKIQEMLRQQQSREKIRQALLGGGVPSTQGAPASAGQALSAPVAMAGRPGPTAQRAGMIGQPTAMPQNQDMFSMLNPMQKLFLAEMPSEQQTKAAFDIATSASEYGAPVNAMIDGKPVQVQYNKFGQARVVQGATPYQATPGDIRGYEYARQQGYTGSFLDYKNATKAGTTVNVDTKGPVSFAQTGGSEAGKMLSGSLNSAQSANRTLQTIDRIVPALDEAILGPAADYRTALYRVGQQLGYTGSNEQILSRTAQVVQGLAQNELTAAEAMKGQGQITEGERALLKRAASGDQNMTSSELRTVMAAMQKISMQRQSDYLDMFGRAKKVKGFSEIAPMYEFNPYAPQADLSGNLATLGDPIAAELARRRKAGQ